MREELVSGDGNTGTVVDERVELVSGEEAFWKKLVGGAKTEVDGRVAVVNERVELTRAGLVSMEVRASCVMVVMVVVVAGIKATAFGRLAVTC